MSTVNEPTQICRCGCSVHQHDGKQGRCKGRHGNCPCTHFRELPNRLQEGEQRRQLTED